MQSPRPVPADLAGELVCTWTATMSDGELLVPDGCVDLVYLGPDDVWVCGPERRAWRSPVAAATGACGMRIRPGRAGALLRLDVDLLADRRVPLDAVVPAARARRVGERLADAADPTDALVGEVRRWRDRADRAPSIDDGIVTAATLPSPPPVRSLADDLGITARHVHRRSRRLFGYGYSVLVRLVRFQRFLQLVRARPALGLARAAAATGYVDQAHLGRECRSITGLTPTALLAETGPTFPGSMSDPYKTADRGRAAIGP